MNEYHKIQTVYKRDPETKYKTLLLGDYSLPEFGYLANNEWVFTEKVDGTNIRVKYSEGKVSFGGKTDRAQIHAELIERLTERFGTGEMKCLFGNGDACLYGEGYGPKIQKGGKYRDDLDFVLFDVFIGGYWLNRIDVEDIAGRLDVDVVPVVGTGTLSEMVHRARAGYKSTWGNFMAEGYVARPAVELKTRGGDRIITKIKYKDFNDT